MGAGWNIYFLKAASLFLGRFKLPNYVLCGNSQTNTPMLQTMTQPMG